jgi:hypothetical protein
VKILIDWPTLIFPGGLGLLYPLGLALPALLVIFARNGGHHLYQHRVDAGSIRTVNSSPLVSCIP